MFPSWVDRKLSPWQSKTQSVRADSLLVVQAAVVNAVLFAAVLGCLPLGFETNDDVGMASIASGFLTGRPSHDLVVSNVLFGYLLQSLYQVTDRVNWYTLCLLATHFAAMTGLLFLFLRTFRSRTSLVLFVLLFAQFEGALLLWLQYTSLAVIAGLVGLLLVTSGLRTATKSHLAVTYGTILIVLSGIIRATSLYYAAVLSLPFLIGEWISRWQWRPIAQTGVVFALALLPIAFDNWHYRLDPAWNHFHKTHALLESLLDAPMVEYSEATRYYFDRVGWSRTDWEILESSFCADPNLYSIPRLTTIVDRFKGSNWGRLRATDYLQNRLSRVIVFVWMTYANLLLALLLSPGGRIKVLLLELCECLLVALLFDVLARFSKLPPHVVLPALFAVNIAAFLVMLDAAAQRSFLIWNPPIFAVPNGLVLGGALAFCACYGWAFYRVARHDLALAQSNYHAQQGFRKVVGAVVEHYVAKDPSLVFLNSGATFPLVFCPPFDNLSQCRRIPLVWLRWGLPSPLFNDRLHELGLGQLYSDMYQKPNVRVFLPPTRIRQFARFAEEHYGERIFARSKDTFLVDDEDGGIERDLMLPVVRMARKPSGAEPSGSRNGDR